MVRRFRHDIANFLADQQSYDKKSPSRPLKLSKRVKRRIVAAVSNSASSVNKIRADLDLDVSKMKLWRVIDQNPNIVRSKMATQPNLKDVHKQVRLDFARNHMAWTHRWENVIWSGEKRFNLDDLDGYSSYWRDLRKEPEFFSKQNFGDWSLMIWAGFSAFGTFSIAFVKRKTNSKGYQDILEANLLP